jgi:16S rRNA (uracil1498-N3)-methyltransferase
VTAGPARGPADVPAVAHVFVDHLDDRCEITGADGHHLQRVRRLTTGEVITAADANGAWRTYEVCAVGDRELALQARGDVEPAAVLAIGVSLAVALTKGGLDDVVAAVTELGVERVIPIRTERVVVRWDDDRARRGVERLRSVAREAAMQSRRARIPIVEEVADLSDLARRPGLVLAERDGTDASRLPPPVAQPDSIAPKGWTAIVGPEGGLAAGDLAWLDGVPRLGLGPHVLRASTAPIAAVAVLVAEALRLGPE